MAEPAAAQRTATAQALGEPSGTPAWRTIPSWYLVARDDALPAAAERFMAARAHAHTTEIKAPVAVQPTDPGTGTNLVKQAAGAQ
ncbi:hypothetical protein ABZ876_32110 [Streptomyces sp. NPDC046931]|uniref:hypothetical protein n=1 Tax=Streptomyces sp. NPDC046931 TaxID=3154806 RepID=UPI003405440B